VKHQYIFPSLKTPVNRNVAKPPTNYQVSAMKGVIFTTTGEALATPTPAELMDLFVDSPKVRLNFAKIFDFKEGGNQDCGGSDCGEDDLDMEGPPPSPSRLECIKLEMKSTLQWESGAPPSCLHCPSIHQSIQHPGLSPSISDPTGLLSANPISTTAPTKPPSSSSAVPKQSLTGEQLSLPTAEYNLSDVENLSGPFFRRADRGKPSQAGRPGGTLRTKGPSKRPSSRNLLRVVAAVNAAITNINSTSSVGPMSAGKGSAKNNLMGPSVMSAKKAREETPKALLRQYWLFSMYWFSVGSSASAI
jgi:NIMA (never in mitosis gene a)-related kinase 2